jgi:hypothetical protein
MEKHVLSGSNEEIAQKIAQLKGVICECVVYVQEPLANSPPPNPDEDMFTEMDPYMVHVGNADDSREAIYTRVEGE